MIYSEHIAPILTGLLVGFVIGISASIPKEEKIRYAAVSVFGVVIAASLGGGLYFFKLEQLNILFEFVASLSVGFITLFIIGAVYVERTRQGYLAIIPLPPDSYEREEILRNIPEVQYFFKVAGNLIAGYKLVASFNIKNKTKTKLDNIDTELKIIDGLGSKKEKTVFKDLAELFPKEEHNYAIEAKLGRRTRGYIAVMKIRRRGVNLGEAHWASLINKNRGREMP